MNKNLKLKTLISRKKYKIIFLPSLFDRIGDCLSSLTNVSTLSSSDVFPINIPNIRVYLAILDPSDVTKRPDKQMVAANIVRPMFLK